VTYGVKWGKSILWLGGFALLASPQLLARTNKKNENKKNVT